MCGIAGWFSCSPINHGDEARLHHMIDAIAHRGPDSQGILMHDHAALGHARLAIIDLQGGFQPMYSHDQRLSVIFNGEIYNYRELRNELQVKGHRFHSHSDTEVILELYRAEGWSGFSRLRGMFAFCLWDAEHHVGLLARDPLGIKPLFFNQNRSGDIQFASEAKGIFAGTDKTPDLDVANLHLLLNFRYIPGSGSLFNGIEQLQPGQVLRWRPDGKTSFHTISIPSRVTDISPLESLRESVKLHFTSDVEVGCYLSGGVDSAAITALGRDLAPQPLRTFTLAVGDDPQEASYVSESASILGVGNIQGDIDEDLKTQLPRLVWHLEIPKINALQVSQLTKLTSRHVKVTLSGLGGDELFLGYNAHRIFHRADNFHHALPPFLSRPLGLIGAGLVASFNKTVWTESERALRMMASLGNWPRVYGLLRNVWDQPSLRRILYGPRMLDARLPDAFDMLEQLWPEHSDPVMAMAKFEWNNKMVNDLLWQEDRCSMAEGLEVRVPFVDSAFSSRIHELDRKTLMKNGKPKYYMRDMLRPILPDTILNRPKSGFQVSAPKFFHQYLKPLAQEWLSDEKIKEYGLFNPAFVHHTLKQPERPGLRWHYFILYFMLMTHLWIDIFEKKSWTQAK